MTSAQYAPAPLRMGMYERAQPPQQHQQQQQQHQLQPVLGMWSSEPYKVDSGGQATSGSSIMEPDAKFDHAGLDEDPQMDELETAGDADQEASKPREKVLRRLAQNREAARKSRLRKKAYIQQLESSRIKLAQLEQELQRARQQQGVYGGSNPGTSLQRHHGGSAGLGFAAAGQMMDPGVAAFEIKYGHWVDEQKRHTEQLRSALQQGQGTSELELQMMVETGLANYDDLFRIKGAAAQSDVFCVMSGLWRSPAERFFLWIGGFRPSEVLKILSPQLHPMTEAQSVAVYGLQLTSAQAEDALSQGMQKLQQTLAESLTDPFAAPDAYMVGAVEKLKGLVGFVQQADHLRLETLQNMHRILTTRQAAKGLLVLGDYFQRLRALSTLWAARPRESAIS
ncbi:transcription factor TGAL6-like isoform X2 [Hordeum vulgare subsp. vulgare]|nr:transcription factor TGAL6-like isoform X2 [Hordeum vulgare subsp. vulgare]